jgi:hypothetical protein
MPTLPDTTQHEPRDPELTQNLRTTLAGAW